MGQHFSWRFFSTLEFFLTSTRSPERLLFGLDTAAHAGGSVLMPTKLSGNYLVMELQDFAYAAIFPRS